MEEPVSIIVLHGNSLMSGRIGVVRSGLSVVRLAMNVICAIIIVDSVSSDTAGTCAFFLVVTEDE